MSQGDNKTTRRSPCREHCIVPTETWDQALNTVEHELRSKCPSLDTNGYVAEMSEVLKIIRSLKRG